jgi:glucokinase
MSDDAANPVDHEVVAVMETPAVDPPGDVVLAVDVGASHFQAGLVTTRGLLLDRARAEIETDVGPESQYTALASIVTEMLERAGSRHSVIVRGLGVSSGGHASRGLEAVSPLSVPGWRDFPLRARLEELSGLGVHGDLDAKALALAEGWLGAAQGQPNFCAITVSAGISGGIILDGDLLDGESGYAGQIGHFIVEPGGRRCTCGTQGCLEAEASGQAIDSITGRPATEPSYQIMQRTGDLVGRAAASMCNAFDLSLVVVGGSVALGFGSTFFHAAQVSLDEHARQPYSRGARITPSRLGDQGPLVGAGAVGWRGLRRSNRRRPAASASQPPNAR